MSMLPSLSTCTSRRSYWTLKLYSCAEAAPAEPEEITVGTVTLSATLWRILADEAGQHLATLDHDLTLLQFDPAAQPAPAMIRAAHTLCGIHRTGGFHSVAALAKSLELALIALAQIDARPATALPVLARAVEALRRLVASIEARQAFRPGDEQEARYQLRADLQVPVPLHFHPSLVELLATARLFARLFPFFLFPSPVFLSLEVRMLWTQRQ